MNLPNHELVDLQAPNPGTPDHQATDGYGTKGKRPHRQRA